MPLFTLGYEGLSVPSFTQILLDSKIETLIDVRQRPQSRKPGFSKNALSELCGDNGLSYRHLAVFGCPLPILYAYREDGDWEKYTENYLKHLETPSLKQAVASFATVAWEERCCLLCFEADENFCHRGFVARAVEAAGGPEVVHLNRKSGLSDLSALVLAGR